MASPLHCPSPPEQIDDLISRLKAPGHDERETIALRALVQQMIEIFYNDRRSTYWSEAAHIAVVADDVQFKKLIETFSNAIIEHTSDNNIVNSDLLQTFSLALRHKGSLSAHDVNLGSVLASLNKRLGNASKSAEATKQYQFLCILGSVLDVMVDIKVSGLDREWLHKPLHDQLRELREDTELRLAQAASYAYEALRGIPDNEGPWQAFGRNSWSILSVVATIAGGVVNMDPGKLVDAVPDVIDLLRRFKVLAETGKQLWDQQSKLKDAFLDAVKGVQKQRQWYSALRYSRLLIEAGAFTLLKEILPGLPPGCGEAYWCGLYDQLEQIWAASSNEQKSQIETFIEWMHGQKCFQAAFSEHRRVREWRRLVAGTFNKPEWNIPTKEPRTHTVRFWKNTEYNTQLAFFQNQVHHSRPLISDLLSTAWEKCEDAKKYYADSRLIQYYTDADRLMIQRLSSDPLDISQCYINLSVVECSSGLRGAREYSEPSLRARIKVEMPEGSEVELRNMFKAREAADGSTGQPRKIFIRGRAGVGKTTLCKKIVYEFIHCNLWSREFDRIIWIPLRKLKAWSNLKEFIENEFCGAIGERTLLGQTLWRRIFGDSNRTLFLLDGFDEVVGERTAAGDFVEAFGDLLNQKNIILTSRPYANSTFSNKFDLHLETIGFNERQVKEYVSKVVDNKDHQMEIEGFIKSNPITAALLRIPVQLDALCFTWGEGLLTPDAKTITALYRQIEIKLWQKDMVQLGKTYQGKLLNDTGAKVYRQRSQVEVIVGNELELIEMLAFHGFHNNLIELHPRHRDAVYAEYPWWNDGMLDGLSFLRSPGSSSERHDNIRYFIHLTFQEYFAAAYFVRRWINNKPLHVIPSSGQGPSEEISPRKLIQQEKYNGRYSMTWRFVAGLLHIENKKGKLSMFFEALQSESRDYLGPAHLRLLMYCLSEVPLHKSDSDVVLVRSNLEKGLSQLLSSPSVIEDEHGALGLAVEAEFPERILGDALKQGPADLMKSIFNALSRRPKLSCDLLHDMMSDLMNATNQRYPMYDVYPVLARHSRSVLDDVIKLLRDPDPARRAGMLSGLLNQKDIPDSIYITVMSCLDDDVSLVARNAGRVLSHSASLPDEVRHALLHDERPYMIIIGQEQPRIQLGLSSICRMVPLPDEYSSIVLALLKNEKINTELITNLDFNHQESLDHDIVTAVAHCAKNCGVIRIAAVSLLGKQDSLGTEVLAILEDIVVDLKMYKVGLAVDAFCRHSPLTENMRRGLERHIQNPDSVLVQQVVKALCGHSNFAETVLDELKSRPDRDNTIVPLHAVFSLGKFTRLPEQILRGLLPYLAEEDPNIGVEAARCIGTQEVLPDRICQAVLCLTKDAVNPRVRWHAAVALGPHLASRDDIRDALGRLLEDLSYNAKREVIKALATLSCLTDAELIGSTKIMDREWLDDETLDALYQIFVNQPSLPLEVFEALVSHMHNPTTNVPEILIARDTIPEAIIISLVDRMCDKAETAGQRLTMWQVLQRRKEFFSLFLGLPRESIVFTFKYLLWMALDANICCYIWEDALYIDLTERQWRMPFQHPDDQSRIEAAMKEAQEEYYSFLPDTKFILGF